MSEAYIPNFFEEASRQKFRFDSPKGALTVEDLWDLPLTGNGASLDGIARSLYKQLQETAEESFVAPAKKTNPLIQRKFVLVKYIIDVRLAESEAATKAKDLKEKKQKLMALIEEKKDESLKQASIDELQRMLDSL